MLIIQPRFTVFLAFVVLAALSVFGPRCSDARDQPAPQVEVTTTIEVPQSVPPGQPFSVKWSGPAIESDTIRVGTAAGEFLRGGPFNFVSKAKGQEIELKAPEVEGDYSVVYFSGKTALAHAPLRVRPEGTWVSATKQVQAGAAIDVAWGGAGNVGDRIALIPSGANAVPNGATSRPVIESTSGGLILRAPKKLGKLDVVYVSGNQIMARQAVEVTKASTKLTVPARVAAAYSFEVGWTGPGDVGDRIMAFNRDTKKWLNEIRHISFVDPRKPTLRFAAPSKPGRYELNYISRKNKVLTKKAFEVVPPEGEMGRLRFNLNKTDTLRSKAGFEIIVDASSSMIPMEDGDSRIGFAKNALSRLVNESLPDGCQFALRVFEGDQTKLLLPMGPVDKAKANAAIARISAVENHKRAIAASLDLAADDLKAITADRNVILVTAGGEGAGGDPQLAINRLQELGSGIRLSVIGLFLEDSTLEWTLAGWAALGNGRFQKSGGRDLSMSLSHAISFPFTLYKDGVEVANGFCGTAPFEFPVGNYEVKYLVGDKTVTRAIEIKAGEFTDLSIPQSRTHP